MPPLFQTIPLSWRFWRAHHCFAIEHDGTFLVATGGFEGDLVLFFHLCRHFRSGRNGIPDPNRRYEPEFLLEINRSRSGQERSQDGGYMKYPVISAHAGLPVGAHALTRSRTGWAAPEDGRDVG
jgi:hypothetical protein